MYSAFPGNCSVSYLSFVYGRSLWAELNGGENSLHWKANMLPLLSIITLYSCNSTLATVATDWRLRKLFHFIKVVAWPEIEVSFFFAYLLTWPVTIAVLAKQVIEMQNHIFFMPFFLIKDLLNHSIQKCYSANSRLITISFP